jgi:uncharacterized protein YegP (UPF0339 family)
MTIDPTNDKVKIYEDEQGLWRWHRYDGDNGRIVSESSEGYSNVSYCWDAAHAYNSGLDDESFAIND